MQTLAVVLALLAATGAVTIAGPSPEDINGAADISVKGMQPLIKRVEADLAPVGVVEQWPKLEGRQMIMILAPKKKH